MIRLALLLAITAAAQPVKLAPYPQKFRTLYSAEDPRIPSMKGLEVRASDGALWTGGKDGLWRQDDRAKPRDRRQYFAGRRYLPDDEVLSLASDASGGI